MPEETIDTAYGETRITRNSTFWIVAHTGYRTSPLTDVGLDEYDEWELFDTEEEARARVTELLETPGNYIWLSSVEQEFHNVR